MFAVSKDPYWATEVLQTEQYQNLNELLSTSDRLPCKWMCDLGQPMQIDFPCGLEVIFQEHSLMSRRALPQ